MAFQGDSIYWVEVEKVVPNPFQPRREFDESKLQELSESIRMYGVLQPLTVTRKEVQNEDGTFYTHYELIAGERRLRASRLAGVAQVPVIIREGEQSEQEKLELAIIENLQREDLNAIDRALAFQQLSEQFNLSHAQVASKVGRSREYVANSVRLLQLPEHISDSVRRGELSEGHARTLLMLNDRPEEQETLFREVLLKKMSVRELERISRKIAHDKVRKPNKSDIDEHLIEIEKEFTETLGTRVQIQKTDFGGKLTIDYFSDEDLESLLARVRAERAGQVPGVTAAAMGAVSGQTPSTAIPPQVTPAPAPATPPQPEPPAETTGEANSATAPAVEPETPSPLESVTPTVDTNTPPTTPEAPPATPDQSLLERLAAHTALSFRPSTDAAATPPETEPPTETTEATTAQPPTVPQPASESHPVTPAPTEPTAPDGAAEESSESAPVHKPDDDENLYSLRNFTV